MKVTLVMALLTTCAAALAGQGGIQVHDGRLYVDGKPFFPIGLYLTIWWEDDNMKTLREAGFNLIGSRGEMKSIADWRRFLDAAQRHCFKAWITLRGQQWWATDLNERTPRPSRVLEERAQFLREFVRTLRDHPALLVWDTCDEINIYDVPVAGLLRGHDLVRQLDPGHPVWTNFTGPLHLQKIRKDEMLANLRAYAPIADIASFDLYPFAYGPEADLDAVGDAIALLNRAVDGKKSVWAVLQADHQPAGRFPTESELRFMTYDALINGATGVLYFGQDVTVGWSKEFRNAIFRVVGELKTLTPVLLSPDDPDVVLKTRWSPVRFRCKILGDERYLIAVNRWLRPVKARFEWKGKDLLDAEPVFEKRRLTPMGNSLEDELPALGSRIYRVRVKEP